MDTEVLVFVPGLLGSVLYDGADRVWPGDGWSAIRGFSNQQFERLMKPGLVAKDIVWSAVGGLIGVYRDWMQFFESMRRLSDNRQMFSIASGTLIAVPYDWRKSCEQAAEEFADALDKVRINQGKDVSVHIVAHSLGGLVVRYYLQCGKYDEREGYDCVKSFFTFGTPHNGAPIALAGAVGLHKTTFLSTEQSVLLASDSRYASLYETFPQADYPLIWERKSNGHLTPRTLADADFALKILKLAPENYEAFLKFRAVIDGNPFPSAVRRFVFMGTRYETLTHFFWTGRTLQAASTQDGGDGTVSIAGAYVANLQCQMTGEAHVSLIQAAEARRAFTELMDATGLLGAGQVEISVRDLSVELNSPIHMSVITDGRLAQVSGTLVIEGTSLPGDVAAQFPKESEFTPLLGRAPQPFTYNGPEILGASVRLAGIGTPGLYRIAVHTTSSPDAVARSPVFAVTAF